MVLKREKKLIDIMRNYAWHVKNTDQIRLDMWWHLIQLTECPFVKNAVPISLLWVFRVLTFSDSD